MELTNKDLRKRYSSVMFVIIVVKDGVEKYVSRDYGRKIAFNYSVLLNKARSFDSQGYARRFMDNNGIEGKVVPVNVTMQLSR